MFCSKCGAQVASDTAKCPYCGQDLSAEDSAVTPGVQRPATAVPEFQKPENIALGTLGALIGALVGGAVIVFFFKLGYVTSLGGLLLAFLTVFLYRKLAGGTIGKVGMLISLALILITPYLAYRIAFTMELLAENSPNFTMGLALLGVDHTFGDLFKNFHYLIDLTNSNGDIMKDLVMLYLFTGLGAFGTLWEAFKGGKKKDQTAAAQVEE